MINFYKRFPKGQLSKDPIPPTGPCSKASGVQETSKQSVVEKDNDGPNIRDNDGFSVDFALSVTKDEPVMTTPPENPCEIDHPIRCPHPKPGIIQDGQALKKRLPSMKRRGQLPFLTKNQVERLQWSSRSAPSDYRPYADATTPGASKSIHNLEPNQ